MDKYDIYKNVRDLEYQHLLNMQNIILGLIGASIITVIFLQELPETWPLKEDVIFLLVLLGILFFFYFRKELNKKINLIRRIKLPEPHNTLSSQISQSTFFNKKP